MVVNKRKKVVRQRAGTTHGYGSMKKNRGAGNRGGRGNAGSGKRGAQKKHSFFHHKKYLGKHGFIRRRSPITINPINLSQIQQHIDSWVAQGKAKKEGDSYTLDCGQLGFTKLLGSGKLNKKVVITVGSASARAKERVVEAGGEVSLPVQPEGEDVVSG